MKYFTPFRISTYLLLFFCLGHTAGGMLQQKSMGIAADLVFEQMKLVRFTFNGSECTWYGFWFGFGLTVSISLVFSAVVSWYLDRVPLSAWSSVSPIAWAFVVAQAATAFLSWKYFFLGPATFGVIITVLMAVGTRRKDAAARALGSA